MNLIEDVGFEIRGMQALREHCVRTVDAWNYRFEGNWDEAVAVLGEEIARVRRLYLVCASMTFRDGRMSVDQIQAQRPGPQGLGPSDAFRAG